MPRSAVTYLDARPSIEVGDLGAALAFWTDVVGFEVDTTMGEPPTFAMLSSRAAALAICQCDQPAIPEIAPVFVTMTGLDGLVDRIASAGLPLESAPTTRPWGIRDLVVRCPGNGPLIAFGEQV